MEFRIAVMTPRDFVYGMSADSEEELADVVIVVDHEGRPSQVVIPNCLESLLEKSVLAEDTIAFYKEISKSTGQINLFELFTEISDRLHLPK
ncbi:MAG: hypothetical protein NTW50_03695 [Candidatus Berkelbacteria bacterium]|nr:hypothetical protein [Candidatus Berkelbacteria bacterium]